MSKQESLQENLQYSNPSHSPIEIEPTTDWRWVEIEGEARALPAKDTAIALSGLQLPAARSDERVVATLSTQQLTINPGGSATIQVTLLNNGTQRAYFHLSVESELEEAWLEPLEQSTLLQPGERSVLEIAIQPPRTSAARAGDYRLTIYADAAEYPGHYTELHAQVTITPFRDLAFGAVRLQSQTVNALRRSVRFAVPLTNTGNISTAIAISGHEQGQRYLYQFAANADHANRQPTLTLEPGQTATVQALVRPKQRAWIGAQPQPLRPALLAQISDEVRAPRVAAFSLYDVPFFGIWTLAGLAAAFVLLLVGLVAAGVLAAGIWWVRQLPTQPIIQQVSAPQAPAQPIVVVVPVNSAPAAAPAQSNSSADNSAILGDPTPEIIRNAAMFNNQGAAALTAPLAINNVPVITAADITQPGSRQPALPAAEQPAQPAFRPVSQAGSANVEPAAAGAGMTYAQMFQEIALRYDLNWRMLAAQAYIESGFDSLALGNDGDMGLMQILPKTWQEFAPQVNVKDPFESYSNTLVAAAYLDYLRAKLGEKGYPQQQWMLVAYNWGPDHVLNFLAAGGAWETLDPKRRNYAEEILRITATIP